MTAQPRFTLHPAHCADGISKSGAGFRVVHTASGKQIGVVAWVGDGWCYSHPADTGLTDDMLHHPTSEAAATALLPLPPLRLRPAPGGVCRQRGRPPQGKGGLSAVAPGEPGEEAGCGEAVPGCSWQ